MDLIAAINRGEAEAFEALYERYREWVANLAGRFTQSHDLALDVLQETFIYFFKKFPGFTLTCQLKTFLYPVVRNLSLNAKAKAGRFQANDEALHQAEAPASDHRQDPATARARLSSALDALSQSHREVLLLRFVEELSLAEIALAMDTPLGTVKSRLHHALEALRQDGRTRMFFKE